MMSAIDVTAKTFFKRHCNSLDLVLGLRKIAPWVNCPYVPTTPTVHSTTISRFPCNFFPQLAPHFFGNHDSPSNLAKSRYPRWQWLFFQNATQVQLRGGKPPIVLYQEKKPYNHTCIGLDCETPGCVAHVSYSFCWGYSLINTVKLKTKFICIYMHIYIHICI